MAAKEIDHLDLLETDQDEIKSIVTDVKKKVKSLILKRGTHKRAITMIVNKLRDSTLSDALIKGQLEQIKEKLKLIETLSAEIMEIYDENGIFQYCEDIYSAEIESQVDYQFDTNVKISEFEEGLAKNSTALNMSQTEQAIDRVDALLKVRNAKVHEVKLPTFKGSQDDVLLFSDFVRQFNDLIGDREEYSDASKLIYLKSYLKGGALDIVKHLSNTDENYKVALDFLTKEYLDRDLLVDRHLKKLVTLKNPTYNDWESLRSFFNIVRSSVYELKNFGLNALESDTLGDKLLSYLICEKLPANFKWKLSVLLKTDYPSVSQLLDSYNEIIKSLEKTGSNKSYGQAYKKDVVKYNNNKVSVPVTRSRDNVATGSLHTFKTQTVANTSNYPKQFSSRSVTKNKSGFGQKVCKLCNENHSMIKCTTYPKRDEKLNRLRQLNLCEYCSGSHLNEECVGLQSGLTFPCTICKSKSHIGAVCDNVDTTQTNLCIFSGANTKNNVILPSISAIVSVTDSSGSRCKLVRCMVDAGSQTSYISDRLKNNLKLKNLPELAVNLRTFMGTGNKVYEVAKCDIYVTPKNRVCGEFLVDKNFDLDYEVPGISSALSNIAGAGYRFADSFYGNSNDDLISGFDVLIGSDLIKYLEPLQTLKIEKGTAYSVQDGLILFGSVSDYLTKEQIAQFASKSQEVSQPEQSKALTYQEKRVNLILNSNKTYFNPIEYAKTDADIDLNVENMFKVESLGIKDSDVSEHEQLIVDKFDEGIECHNDRYFVEIPFKEEISQVPSNWQISLATLDRVIKGLRDKNLVTEYESVFNKQLELGIIEEIKVDPKEYNNFTFIPHHPVIKHEEQVTTKLRVVFNASLKASSDALSLNQATFQGIDLLTNLLVLIMKFRQNKYTILSDIEKAFLQIYLKNVEDKNHFCFFWKKGNDVVVYRYKTIIFGLNCSPFILNHVIRHHLNKFENNFVVQALKNSFYVDNFVFSTSNLDDLYKVYYDSQEIMAKGGFKLRSFSTNYEPLKTKMIDDGVHVDHNEIDEKLLGYLYDKERDVLKLANYSFKESSNLTKRDILSNVSKVFDPLSLVVPVTIRGRLLMKLIWAIKLEWDQIVPDDIRKSWLELKDDLLMLKTLEFPRMTCDMSKEGKYSLHFFCDGSKSSYGFCCYATYENEGSQLIFSKAKVSPVNKSIPQIELLSVFLALKCLPLVLDSFDCEIKEVNVWSDAQIVLEWVLSGPKVNNKFTKNRVHDIKSMKEKIEGEHGFMINYQYVHTKENVADMLTRGIKFKEFREKLSTWMNGPVWLNDKLKWPVHEMNCLSDHSKQTITNSTTVVENKTLKDPILNFKDYSNFAKLMKVTAKVLLFVDKLKKRVSDTYAKAKTYWLKYMQQQDFNDETNYLSKTEKDSKNIPNLVRDLNLFIDDQGLIRCKGRLSKLNVYSYNVLNPILLSKTNHLTKLLVTDQHVNCKHLGVGTTLMELRESGYWLPAGRQVVKEILKECIACQKINAFSLSYPKLTNLPKERLVLIKPYLHTAIDYTGHLFIYDENKEPRKVYLVLYTCLALRCVHLDIVPDLTLRSFLQSFKRFTSTYCSPESIYTDNASYFRASKRYLSDAFLSDEFEDHLQQHSIKHKTIPARASWVGGIYERQIKTVKQCMYKSIGRKKLSYFELITYLAEIQNCINGRPITYVHSELDEVEALTPNKILKLHTNPRLQLVDSTDKDPLWTPETGEKGLHEALNKNLKNQNELFEGYKKLWYGQYLLSLREHTKDTFQTSWENRLAVGNIVLVNTEDRSRVFWLMGRVTRLIYSDDGKVRSVFLKMPNKQQAHYSIKHLYPLEVQTMHLGDRMEPNTEERKVEELTDFDFRSQGARPKRKAALKMSNMIKNKIASGEL